MDKLQFEVFVENPQGATTKIHHDEEKLVPLFEEPVSWPYPYGYGFVLGVESGDGDCLDAFVISKDVIPSGTLLTCAAIALLEQWQNEDEDHDVIAVPIDELGDSESVDLERIRANIAEHMEHVFSHDPDRTLQVGRLLPASAAEALVRGETLPKEFD
jgi:inorganic pyrophosphatase